MGPPKKVMFILAPTIHITLLFLPMNLQVHAIAETWPAHLPAARHLPAFEEAWMAAQDGSVGFRV